MCLLRCLLGRLEKLVQLNWSKTRVLSRLWEANQSSQVHELKLSRLRKAWEVKISRLYRTMEVTQSSNQTRTRQIGLHMEIWRLVHLEYHLTLLTR
jgi:hypothetical protein